MKDIFLKAIDSMKTEEGIIAIVIIFTILMIVKIIISRKKLKNNLSDNEKTGITIKGTKIKNSTSIENTVSGNKDSTINIEY